MSAQSHQLAIRRIGATRSYHRNAEIVREDDPANHVYQVLTGTLCTCRTLRDGRRQIAGFYFSNDFFGLEAIEKHSLAVQAITKASVRVVKKQALNALVSSNHAVSDYLLSLTTHEIARNQKHFLVLSRSAYERVICFLVEMAPRTGGTGNRIELPMTRQDTADYLGLSIETVSRVFWDLERRGAIEVDGYRSVVLRNEVTNARGKSAIDIFAAVKGRSPNSQPELEEWLTSPEGKAATLSLLGDRARS